MALFQSTQAAAGLPIPSADCATDTLPIFADFTVPTGFASGDVVEMLPLPAGYVLVDCITDTQSLGATCTSNVGLLSGYWGDTGARTCGAQINSAKAFGTAGIYRADVAGFGRIAPATDAGSGVQANRSIGFVASTVATPTVGAVIRMTALVRPSINGA